MVEPVGAVTWRLVSPIRRSRASTLALRLCVGDRLISTIHDHGAVDSIRVGRIMRALRHRRGWRQVDVARAAGASQTLVSRAERGDIDRMEIRTLRRLATMLQAELIVMVRWRGGDLTACSMRVTLRSSGKWRRSSRPPAGSPGRRSRSLSTESAVRSTWLGGTQLPPVWPWWR